MDKTITMRRKRKGIEIVVVIRENHYDFYIDITPQADLSKKIVEKDYTMKLRFNDGRKSTNQPIHLEILNKRYRDNEIANNSKLAIKNDEYRFEISLSPKLMFYPANYVKQRKNKKVKRKLKGKLK